jgi:hypothetical protein
MLPFLGRGDRGAERGVKLALIGMQFHRMTTSTIHEWTNSTCSAGIKDGLYDNETLAAYLLYRLNALNQSGMVIMYPNSMTSLIDFPFPAFPHLNPFG